jgi:hypothetical protein
MRTILLFISFLTFVFSSKANDPERIHRWQQGRLEWRFFQKNDATDSPAPAFSSLGVAYSFDVKNGTPVICFEAFLDPASSWVKSESLTEQTLLHEQLMFDIAEWHARKMRKSISAFRQKGNNSYSALVTEIKNVYQRELNAMFALMNQINAETNYGQDLEAEEKWRIRIKGELTALGSFTEVQLYAEK